MIQLRACAALTALAVLTAACSGSGTPLTPAGLHGGGAIGSDAISGKYIKHVVVIVQENRSFDNLFATFPGVDGATSGYYLKKTGGKYVKTQVALKQVPLAGALDINHASQAYNDACDGKNTYPKTSCDMDGFNLEGIGGGLPAGTYPYQYVNPNDIKPYWQLAKQYAIADHMFATQGSGSFTAHQDLIAGTTAIDSTDSVIDYPNNFSNWGCAAPPSTVTSLLTTGGQYEHWGGPFPCFTYPTGTLRDLLDAKGVTWKYYAPPYTNKTAGALWNAFAAIDAVYNGPEWNTNVSMPETNVLTDISAGNLPQISWVIPDQPDSDHPNGKNAPDDGPSWVAQVVDAVGTSKYWKSTAIVNLWDDWGGFYDHEPPAFFDNMGGLGFRVPMIVVSPYVPANEIVHKQYEFGSILKFIETNFGLGSLGTTDARAASILNIFNFKQSARSFKKIPSLRSRRYFLTRPESTEPVDSE